MRFPFWGGLGLAARRVHSAPRHCGVSSQGPRDALAALPFSHSLALSSAPAVRVADRCLAVTHANRVSRVDVVSNEEALQIIERDTQAAAAAQPAAQRSRQR